MWKLYYSAGACSLAPHITLREAGFPFELEKVDLGKKVTEKGEDFNRINPKGYVPALGIDGGEVLTEVAVILQYIADRKPEAGLAPKAGTLERYRLMEWLNFIASEIHKGVGALFQPKISGEWKESQLALASKRLEYVAGALGRSPFVAGDRFTVADAYLFTTVNWCNYLKIDLGTWPKLKEYMDKVASRPSVKEAMKAEGLLR